MGKKCYYYNTYLLTIAIEDLDKEIKHGRDKIFAASLFARNKKLSLEEVSKISSVGKSTLFRFIHNDLKEICPRLYEECMKIIRIHKSRGRKSIKELDYANHNKNNSQYINFVKSIKKERSDASTVDEH